MGQVNVAVMNTRNIPKRELTLATVLDAKDVCTKAINEAIEHFRKETGCNISDMVVAKSDRNGVHMVGLKVEIF